MPTDKERLDWLTQKGASVFRAFEKQSERPEWVIARHERACSLFTSYLPGLYRGNGDPTGKTPREVIDAAMSKEPRTKRGAEEKDDD